jgi:hypothetical protein
MTEHFLHLVQIPSGISRLRDFDAPILGFFNELKEAPGLAGNASELGNGRFFFEKIDAILLLFRL